MEVEIVTNRTTTSAAHTPMSIEPPSSNPPASQQSIFEPESLFEPLPMSTEPSLKDSPLPLPVAMSVSPQVEPAAQTDATEMKSDDEESCKSSVAKDVNNVFIDQPEKSEPLINRGEKPRQGIRVLLPKGESELDTEEEDLGSSSVETLHRSSLGGVQEQEDSLFKSPLRPALPSPVRTTNTTLADPPLVGSHPPAPANPLLGSGHSLGNLSPASLPSPGYTPRSG